MRRKVVVVPSAPANMGFQNGVAQAQHDDRQAAALADYNLATGGSEADYGAALAAAEAARQDDYNQAYTNFATVAMPAISQQGGGDAAAELLDRRTLDDDDLADIMQNNQAVDGYQDEESTLYAGEQTADAQALYAEQISNALGHAAALANSPLPPGEGQGEGGQGEGQGEGDPWRNLAISQALTTATFQISQAAAALTQSISEANGQSTAEQTSADALESQDNTNAQTEHDEDEAQASADEAAAAARAAAADAVFENLPDTLIAPADGPVLTLVSDFRFAYDANDYYREVTAVVFGQAAEELAQGQEWAAGDPVFLPSDLGNSEVAYDWTGYGRSPMPWGLVGGAPDASNWIPDNMGLTETAITDPGMLLILPPERQALPHLIHGGTIPQDYTDALHQFPLLNGLLDPANAPSSTGTGGYSQSPIPTTLAASDLASTGTPSQTPASQPHNSPLFAPMSAPSAAPQAPGGEGAGSGGAVEPASEAPSEPAVNAEGGSSETTDAAGGAKLGIAVIEVKPDPNKEPAEIDDRATGEPAANRGSLKLKLVAPNEVAEGPLLELANGSGESPAPSGASMDLIQISVVPVTRTMRGPMSGKSWAVTKPPPAGEVAAARQQLQELKDRIDKWAEDQRFGSIGANGELLPAGDAEKTAVLLAILIQSAKTGASVHQTAATSLTTTVHDFAMFMVLQWNSMSADEHDRSATQLKRNAAKMEEMFASLGLDSLKLWAGRTTSYENYPNDNGESGLTSANGAANALSALEPGLDSVAGPVDLLVMLVVAPVATAAAGAPAAGAALAAQPGEKQFYSYFYGPLREGGMVSSTGRVYVTTAAPGAWATEQSIGGATLRFLRTGHLAPFDGYFTTGIVDPSTFGLSPVPWHIVSLWKQLGAQYSTGVGVGGFETAEVGSTLLIPRAIPASARLMTQATVGSMSEYGVDVVVVGTSVYVLYARSK